MRMTVHDDAYTCMKRVTVVSNASPTDRPRDDRGAGVPRVRQAVGPNPPCCCCCNSGCTCRHPCRGRGGPRKPSIDKGRPSSLSRPHPRASPPIASPAAVPQPFIEARESSASREVCRVCVPCPPRRARGLPISLLRCAVPSRTAFLVPVPASRARSVGRSGESRCVRAVLDE